MHQVRNSDLCRRRFFAVHVTVLSERQQLWRYRVHLVRQPDQRMGHDQLGMLHDHLHSLQKGMCISQRAIDVPEYPSTVRSLDRHGCILTTLPHQWLHGLLSPELVGFFIPHVLRQYPDILRGVLCSQALGEERQVGMGCLGDRHAYWNQGSRGRGIT